MARQREWIRDHYRQVIHELMGRFRFRPSSDFSYVIPADAGLQRVLRYTNEYVMRDRGPEPHYRFNRYREMPWPFPQTARRLTHIDIGCGTGLFSWALLDRATEQGILWDRLSLYGFDHSHSMTFLAREVHDGLANRIDNLVPMSFYHDVGTLLQRLTERHSDDTDYVITFGYVLVQAQTSQEIQTFGLIIAKVMELIDNIGNCTLLAFDSSTNGRDLVFHRGWDALLAELGALGIYNQPLFQSFSARAAVTLFRGTDRTSSHHDFSGFDDANDLPF